MTDRDRAIALDRALRVAASDRVEPFAAGRALFHTSLPRVWDLNVLLVEGPGDGLDAPTLAAAAERLQGAAGLPYRRAVVDHEALGARLEPGMVALGWQPRPLGVMVHRRALDRPADPAVAREVDLPALQDVHATYLRTQPYGADDETVRQLLEADAVQARAGRARHFAGFLDGRPACFLSLYGDGRVAQLQAMATLPEARGKGLARNVMALGVQTAAAAGHELITLATVEPVPWVRDLYTRMGFELVGRWFAFTRPPG